MYSEIHNVWISLCPPLARLFEIIGNNQYSQSVTKSRTITHHCLSFLLSYCLRVMPPRSCARVARFLKSNYIVVGVQVLTHCFIASQIFNVLYWF